MDQRPEDTEAWGSQVMPGRSPEDQGAHPGVNTPNLWKPHAAAGEQRGRPRWGDRGHAQQGWPLTLWGGTASRQRCAQRASRPKTRRERPRKVQGESHGRVSWPGTGQGLLVGTNGRVCFHFISAPQERCWLQDESANLSGKFPGDTQQENQKYMLRLLWKTAWQLLKKSSIELSRDSAIPLQGICSREVTHVHSKTCTCVATAALFIVAKTWKQHRHLHAEEWINTSEGRRGGRGGRL